MYLNGTTSDDPEGLAVEVVIRGSHAGGMAADVPGRGVVLGSFGRAASAVALVYLLGLLVLPVAPETRVRSPGMKLP
jgi:hypothetical protein